MRGESHSWLAARQGRAAQKRARLAGVPRAFDTPSSRPGFRAGVRSLAAAFALLARKPSLWPWAAVPVLVFSCLIGAALTFGVALARHWLLERLPHASAVRAPGTEAASVALIAVIAVLGWVLAALLTPPLSARPRSTA